MKILRRRLIPHENHLFAECRALLGDVGMEDRDTAGRSGAGRQTDAERRSADARVDHRVQ